MQKYFISVAMLGIIAAFILSACGFAAANRTPTSPPLNPAAVYTAAAQTVFAELTQQVQAALLGRYIYRHSVSLRNLHASPADQPRCLSYPCELCKCELYYRCHHPGWDAAAGKYGVHQDLARPKHGHLSLDNQLPSRLFTWRGHGWAVRGIGRCGSARPAGGHFGQVEGTRQDRQIDGCLGPYGWQWTAVWGVAYRGHQCRRPESNPDR